MKNIEDISEKQLGIITPSEREVKILNLNINSLVLRLNSELRKIGAFTIIGGSFAKQTIIRRNRYDIDLFVKFDYEKYRKDEKQISRILLKILEKINKNGLFSMEILHGSRDYFRIYLKDVEKLLNLPVYIEIVPVLSIRKAGEALNVTDMSPLHVNYVLSEIKKNPDLAGSIKLAKSFCYGQGCYGAESHIRGFSGYSLELLCMYFGSFLKLLRAAAKWNAREKTILDIPKFYKNKEDIMMEMNESKILSPLILVDPVQPSRNATAALNDEKMQIFIKAAKAFLKNPSLNYFVKKEITKEDMRRRAKARGMSLMLIKAKSAKEKEDVAGAKLFKLFSMLLERFHKEGKTEGKWRYYEQERKADFFFLFKPEKKLTMRGPPLRMEKNVQEFRKKWRRTFVKAGIVCAYRKSRSLKEIISIPKEQMKEMGIKEIKLSAK